MLLADFKDAVANGNGEYLSVIRKQLLLHFFSTPGFNEFEINVCEHFAVSSSVVRNGSLQL